MFPGATRNSAFSGQSLSAYPVNPAEKKHRKFWKFSGRHIYSQQLTEDLHVMD